MPISLLVAHLPDASPIAAIARARESVEGDLSKIGEDAR